MQKAVLTLYTAIGKPDRIPEAIQKHFQGVTSDLETNGEETKLTLQDDSTITFNLSHQQDNAEFIDNHIGGMANFFSQAETEQADLKANVIRQIQCFNCVTGITFYLDENEDRTEFILNSIYRIAKDIRGFILYPSMQIYTSEGKLLFSAEGESELTEFRPIANADLLEMNRPEETEADKARQQRSITRLEAKNVPYMEHLRATLNETEAKVKSREEIVRRAAGLFTVAVYSEALLTDHSSPKEAQVYVNKMEELYGAKAFLSPKEIAYLDDPAPEEQTCIQFVWRYEACAALLWAAGVTDELPYPSEIVDVPILATIFWEHKGLDKLLAKGYARPEAEILDEADVTLRYDWACVDARIHGKEAPASLDGGVVVERHYAFNWIIGANEGAEWDDIQPNT